MTGAADPAMLSVGDVVDKYRVERLIGEGAMGRVYHARHVLLGHDVAIKLLRASAATEHVRARFIREAKAMMALRSDHVVRVFDLGILPSNTPYMVLEHLEGIDLRSLVDQNGALPVETAVDYTLQACEALGEAHLNGIIHRDLKPHNLFRTLRPDGTACIKLLDFGVSKFEERPDEDHELTSSQVLLGSPVFMSPEQIRSSSKVDARTDVWSLGVVLYMLLGGGRPFEGDGLPGLCAAIMVDPPRPLAERCPSVPPALEAVILRCLEKSRDRRLPNVAEVARALEPFASAEGRRSVERLVRAFGSQRVPRVVQAAEPRSAAPPEEALGASTSIDPLAVDRPPPAPEPVRRRAWTRHVAGAVAGLAAAGVLVAVVALLMSRTGTEPSLRGGESTTLATATSVTPPSSGETAAQEVPAEASSEPPPEAPASAAAPDASPPRRTGPAPRRQPAAGPAHTRGTRSTKAGGRMGAVETKPQVDRNGIPIVD